MSIADLHQPRYKALLNSTMRIGLRYLKHINEPVTRDQAEITLVRSLPFRRPTLSPHTLHKAFIRAHISHKFEVHLTGA
jgi:hypothetical protein